MKQMNLEKDVATREARPDLKCLRFEREFLKIEQS
jgi:hypothetical protein